MIARGRASSSVSNILFRSHLLNIFRTRACIPPGRSARSGFLASSAASLVSKASIIRGRYEESTLRNVERTDAINDIEYQKARIGSRLQGEGGQCVRVYDDARRTNHALASAPVHWRNQAPSCSVAACVGMRSGNAFARSRNGCKEARPEGAQLRGIEWYMCVRGCVRLRAWCICVVWLIVNARERERTRVCARRRMRASANTHHPGDCRGDHLLCCLWPLERKRNGRLDAVWAVEPMEQRGPSSREAAHLAR
eukprot:scaffold87151_cov33-Tisochrysis_lutea.AAC.1